MSDLTANIYLRDSTLARQGVLEDYDKLQMKLRWADVSTWALDVSADSAANDVLQAGGGIITQVAGQTLLTGTVEDWTETLDGDQLTFSYVGYDDTWRLNDRIVLPASNPATAATGYDDRSGPAETVMRGYVRAQLAGDTVDPSRVDPQVLLAAVDGARGGAVRYLGRFESLLLAVQTIALRGGDLGFRIIQGTGQTVEFQVIEGGDRSQSALFSRDLGNLRGYVLKRTRNTGNVVYVAAQGELANRTVVQRADLASIIGDGVRREVLVDQRQTDDPVVMIQAGDAELAKRTGAGSIALTPIDTDGVAFLRDYQLGDVVTAQGLLAVVREIDLTFDSTGSLIEPLIGAPGAINPRNGLAQFAARRSTDSRVSNLERR